MKYHNAPPDLRKKVEAGIVSRGLSQAVRIVDSMPYEQMPDLYRAANVTISIPTFDATPMALLESMATESAPVFSDLPSLREWITDGWNGYLVAPADHVLLAKRIIYLLKNPDIAQEFALRNRAIVKHRASQAANMSIMEHIYQRLTKPTAVRAAARGFVAFAPAANVHAGNDLMIVSSNEAMAGRRLRCLLKPRRGFEMSNLPEIGH